ncbi:MAG: hypothetical protein EOS25_26380 [Mesorhizobium sp.]|uniref:hypothetical protein n=1 Tax=Mesorhizobium sp. TaxID=1871066 RepID=UPI000FE561D7|nr:hypothetical protein [Mesorhizobium sp.]RWD50576.1 MAG: hypothetical protein EOS59_09270 [Mesorhizobium sp.]RWE55791.1 MAG: hypothetical protein EOS24_23255 [Mesorhizobium sp.]RWF09696.1 MAG: hypothetical protein EOS69_17250 [Mesorhizobium sp.]RWF14648.1 MAG: hypothetical protein EOS25_26380 [Mesorhizobium sp.]TIX86037.1 MAG: hypothetical protein E5V21_02365 [Mesorhizobium sp.]
MNREALAPVVTELQNQISAGNMVREILKRENTIHFGTVSLSVDDLIEIIESKQFSNVKAQNNKVAFDDLSDMKNNKALLVGYPNITCDDISISFKGFFGSSIYVPSKPEDLLSKAKSIEAEFRQRKGMPDFVREKQKYITLPYWICMGVFLFSIFNIDPNSSRYPQFKTYSSFMTAYSLLALIVYMNWGYIEYIRKSVYYRASEGLFRRNIEKIVVGVIGALLGAAVKAFIDRF